MSARHGLELRAAHAADAPGLAELLESAGPTVAARELGPRLDRMRQGAGTVLLAVEWGPPSGVVALHWFATLHSDGPNAQIDLLLVAPDARRRGLGRLLVKAAAQAARVAGCRTLQIAAGADDAALAAFCQATGFAEAGTLLVRSLRRHG